MCKVEQNKIQIINNSTKCNVLIKELKRKVQYLMHEKIKERDRLEINKYMKSEFNLKLLLQRKKL